MAVNLQPMHRIKRVHFIGIGGVGMCGIAEVLLGRGYQVSGSDIQENAAVHYLRRLGATIFIGHEEQNVQGADVIVKSTAIGATNPELLAAQQLRIPIIPRAEMLAELMRFSYGIAITGTHGKTTTTSLVANMLAEASLDPTFVIGGKLNNSNTYARLGQSQYFVVEADESDASFLYVKPMMSIVTNIDADHMSTYNHDFGCLEKTFLQFLHHLPFYGMAILCIDDSVIRKLIPQINRPMCTYGFSDDADIRVTDWQVQGRQSAFVVHSAALNKPMPVTLNLPGRHNVLNALAAITVALELGLTEQVIQESLQQFSGIDRRFQVYGKLNIAGHHVLLVDDYAHHPTEIQATLTAARDVYPEQRLVVCFQPHRYSRTQDLFADFVAVLSAADVLIVPEIYSASEQPIPGISSTALCERIQQQSQLQPFYLANLDELPQLLADITQADDVLLTLGAGSIGRVAQQLANDLISKS